MIRNAVGTADEEATRAMVSNLRHDRRVSKRREAACALDWSSVNELQQSYGKYYDACIRRASTPDFTQAHNRRNLVYGPGISNRLHAGLLLVALYDVRRLHGLYSQAYEDRWQNSKGEFPFKAYPRFHGEGKPPVIRWIDFRMTNLARRHALIGNTLDYMAVRLKHNAFFHPIWCSTFGDIRKQPPTQWPLMLGLGHWIKSQRWWFAVCYQAHRAKIIVNPTVLDSQLSEYFFPTPLRSDSGHPVNVSGVGGGLQKEHIHSQIELSLDDHLVADESFALIKPFPVRICDVRKEHWIRLNRQYGAGRYFSRWMERKATC
jgi:hypothetical protein